MDICYDTLLGAGSYGRVYAARITSTGSQAGKPEPGPKEIALKRVRYVSGAPSLIPMLRHEACALTLLQGHPSIPQVYAFGASQYFEYLAMQRLGADLYTLFVKQKERLTLRNLASIAYQMLDALEHVHNHGTVHCDVSLSNTMFVGERPSPTIYLIDFGLCLPYKDPSTGRHRPDTGIPRLRGSTPFASLNIHLHHSPSRRDDLESLAYAITALLRGGLPWKGLEDRAVVYKRKLAWSGEALCTGWPSVFGEFLDYCRCLQHEDTPQYHHWRQRFASEAGGPQFTPQLDPGDDGICVGAPRHDGNSNTLNTPVPVPRESLESESAATVTVPYPQSAEWPVFYVDHDQYATIYDSDYEPVWSLQPEDSVVACNEEKAVLARLQGLGSVPASSKEFLDCYCPAEELVEL